MKYLDLTLRTPEANLACDEALLNCCEELGGPEVLRIWEPTEYFVVLGYANRAEREANLDACRARHIPVLRRCSGGGAVLQGSGCLNYSLILRVQESGPLQGISETNTWIMNRHRDALALALNLPIEIRGHTDLAFRDFKFSGNAQRRRRNCLIFHGTFLLNLNLRLVRDCLPLPSKQPAYRQKRSHLEFLMNLDMPSTPLKTALRRVWRASEPLENPPMSLIHRLTREKYATMEWNLKF